jgi:hypothetical protein
MTIKQITTINKQKKKHKHTSKKAKKPKNTYGLELNPIPNTSLMFK